MCDPKNSLPNYKKDKYGQNSVNDKPGVPVVVEEAARMTPAAVAVVVVAVAAVAADVAVVAAARFQRSCFSLQRALC